jgi:hypothetical protein
MDEDYDFVEAPDGQVFMLQDKVSARILAYSTLVELSRNVKEPELFAECLEMLKALRLSIGFREASISAIKGGRGN